MRLGHLNRSWSDSDRKVGLSFGERLSNSAPASRERQQPAEKRGKFTVGKSISERPKEVRSRETFGHWELDTGVSGRGKSKGCVATFIERKTRLYTAITMPNRTALSDGDRLWCGGFTVPLRHLSNRKTEGKNLPTTYCWRSFTI
ncbi:UNVERIFIED_CONTAM: IS30 family transposase [Paenibacillus sp. PvR008]